MIYLIIGGIMDKKRNIYFDVLKIVSTILVIINHSHLLLKENGKIYHIIHFSMFGISKIAVPIFIMITGALMLNKNNDFKSIKKRIIRVYIACLFSTLIGIYYYKLDLIKTLFSILLGGQINDLYFLWYIYIIVIFYLLTPLIKKMIKNFNKKNFKYFFLILLFIPSAIQYILFLFEFDFNIVNLVGRVYDQYSFLINIGYFVYGYYICKYKGKDFKKNVIYFFLGFLLSLLYLCLGYINKGEIVNLKYDSLPVVLMSINLFEIGLIIKKDYNLFFKNIIINLSQCSFGIYLTHVYLIDYLMKTIFFTKLFNFNLFFGYFTLVIFVYLSLAFLFYLIRKIPVFRKIF